MPAANAVWAEDRILRFEHSDIGIAVAIEGGLITPVIRQAELKSLTAISAEMRELAERARARKLKPNEYQGGASAISNLGMYGVREFSAIINPPHATILAVGASRRQAVEKDDGSVGFESMMTVTLSCDHRVVDGALGAELLAAFKRFCRAAGDGAGVACDRHGSLWQSRMCGRARAQPLMKQHELALRHLRRRYVRAAVCAGWLVHGGLLKADYERIRGLLRPMDETRAHILYVFLAQL